MTQVEVGLSNLGILYEYIPEVVIGLPVVLCITRIWHILHQIEHVVNFALFISP